MSAQRGEADAGAEPIRPARPAAGGGAPSGDAESEILRAALSVYRHLELRGQIAALSGIAAEWTAAAAVFGIGIDPETGGPVPLAATVEETDPVYVLLSSMPADVLASAFDAPGPHAGLGPFAVGAPSKGGAKTTLIVPLRDAAGGRAGMLVAVDPRDDARVRLDALAGLLSEAFANADQVRAIRELTIRDDTADCFNRRHFEEFLVEELARANRFKTPMSLIFFDMDNLKEVNNRWGHPMGSRTLHEVSRRVRGKIRRFDKLFRFGGDEFCIVLPETEWHGALEVAERVREAISSRSMLSRELGEGKGPLMTASFGIASFPLHARTKEELVVRADRAMQSVKNTTKNSIAVADLDDHAGR